MNTIKSMRSIFLLALLAVSFTGCKKDDPKPVVLTATTFKNLAADPPSGGYNPTNGQPIGVTKKYTFFSFKTGAIVANADSTSTKWDIGFSGTIIIVNSSTSGPGAAGAIVQTGIFDEITTAPVDGYLQDNKNSATAKYAILTGSGNGWYNYTQATNIVSPIAGRVLIFKTADGKYAKMEILSYYQDAPAAPTSTTKDRYYTFRYIYQADGSKTLK